MTAPQAAADYIKRGWRVVPLQPGDKVCINSDWPRLVFKPDDFQPNDNIGIMLINGLVDIDCDAMEVVACASDFLPPTGAIYGRASKPRSHWLYSSKISEPLKYEDLTNPEKKASLIEVRVNHQSMAPPSIHPSGEEVTWFGIPGPATEIEADLLKRAAQLIATAAMIIRYYNPPGARHEWMLALCGSLRQFGVTEVEAEKIITVAAKQSGDTKLEDRLRELRDTYAKSEDDALKGQRALESAMLTGKQFLASIRKIWGADTSGISKTKMEQMNSRHAVIFQQSGELVIITEDRDVDNRPFIRFSSPETIKQLYPELVQVGTTGRGSPITKPLGQVWLNSPRRRFYNGIELAPNGRATPGYYNMWRGFAVEPQKGKWEKFYKHIHEVICAKQDHIFEYVYAWMANAVQKPGHQANTAIALRGGQGTGKGAFVRGFGALFGVHFVHLDSTRHLTGNFNAHLHNAILVFADEAAWPGDKAGLGALKRLVTEPTLSIERKGMDIMTVPNMIHLLLASNEEWVVPAAIDERRFTVLDVDKSRQNDTKYFATIEDELYSKGGLSAMLYDLLDHKISIDLRVIPKTNALYEQKRLTGGIQRRWWYQLLHDGDLWRNEVPGAPGNFRIDRQYLYDNYVNTLDRAGQRMKSIQTELGIFLAKVMPKPYPQVYRQRSQTGGWLPREWIFPSLKVCREFYDNEYGITTESNWPEEEDPRTLFADSDM